MTKNQINEWVDGSLKDSETFSELSEEKRSKIKSKILKDIDLLFRSNTIEFNCLVMVKCSKLISKSNWAWQLNDKWPYQNWQKIKKAAVTDSKVELGIEDPQIGMYFLTEEV